MIIRVAGTDRGKNHQVMFASYYLHKFLKLCILQTKSCINYCFLLLLFLLRGFSALNSIDPLQGPPQGLKSSL